jgi:hypothetical protein
VGTSQLAKMDAAGCDVNFYEVKALKNGGQYEINSQVGCVGRSTAQSLRFRY